MSTAAARRALAKIALVAPVRIMRRLLMHAHKPLFRKIGRNVIFSPFSSFSYGTIEIGDDVFIGAGANFLASESGIRIADKVMFGPNVTILGGDHRTDVVGRYLFDVKDKVPENDRPVCIDTDVWVGAGATILKGVTVGRGAIVAAGAIVTKDVAPYAIVAGIPARAIGRRFDDAQIAEHEEILGLT
jgi:acetyltransferase-like isoleucine patch superfamily enzyme